MGRLLRSVTFNLSVAREGRRPSASCHAARMNDDFTVSQIENEDILSSTAETYTTVHSLSQPAGSTGRERDRSATEACIVFRITTRVL